MSKVFSALAVSVDGDITGRDPGAGRGLGDGAMAVRLVRRRDIPSQLFDGFRLSESYGQTTMEMNRHPDTPSTRTTKEPP